MYAVKVSYKGEVRRLQLDVNHHSGSAYAKLSNTIRSIFPGLSHRFSLTWTDDEGDVVSVSSDLELQEAIRVMLYQYGILKFTVNDVPPQRCGAEFGHPQCFKNRGGCYAPLSAPPGSYPCQRFERRGPHHPYHPQQPQQPFRACGRGVSGPRDALFHLFGRPHGPVGLGPRIPPSPAFPPVFPSPFPGGSIAFGLPLDAMTEIAEALAQELSEVIKTGDEGTTATAKNGVTAKTAAAATAAAPKAPQSEGSVVHVGVTCDVCGVSPITGPRYKCTVRDNYDVCAACYESELQPYPMLKIVTNGGVGTVVHPGAETTRDLNDEDAGLQAAISASYASATSAAPVPAAEDSLPPALTQSTTIRSTTATVDEEEEGVEDVYSEEGGFSVVSNTTAGDFSLAEDRAAAAAIASIAPAAAPKVEATTVWARELKLLADMGFTDPADLIPLLQQHITTPASVAPTGETSVEGIQKVISTLLFR